MRKRVPIDPDGPAFEEILDNIRRDREDLGPRPGSVAFVKAEVRKVERRCDHLAELLEGLLIQFAMQSPERLQRMLKKLKMIEGILMERAAKGW